MSTRPISFPQQCLPAAIPYHCGFTRGVRACGKRRGENSLRLLEAVVSPVTSSSHYLLLFFLQKLKATSF